MRTPRGFIALTLGDSRKVRFAIAHIVSYFGKHDVTGSVVFTTDSPDGDAVSELPSQIDELILAEQEFQDNYASLILHRYNTLQQQNGKSEGPF